MRFFRSKFLLMLFYVLAGCFYKTASAQEGVNLKADIYPKIADRQCLTMPLSECDCPEARQMRAYIEALSDAGVGREDIFYRVAKRFSLSTILDEQAKAQVKERLIQEAGKTRPQIVIEPALFDFGKLSRKQGQVVRVFKLYNKGDSDLQIKYLRTSCPCSIVSFNQGKRKSAYFGMEGSPKDWQAAVKPGETAEIEFILDLTHHHVKTGRLIREVLILSNDPVYPEITARIEAEVQD